MKVSVVIPVWNGESVIVDCLSALFANSGAALAEVICVENASSDSSAALISQHFPQVQLLRQPVNLGFAGGVNIGIAAALSELIILLNQDCIVYPNWLDYLVAGMDANPSFGIAGCTILNPDETVNHAGAVLEMPLLQGRHLTEVHQNEAQKVDYVTGAVFAIRRSTVEQIGTFDEGYFPAYYEETDYCFRARAKGIAIGYVPTAQVRHLFQSSEWKTNPLRHTANQHYSRYRFAVKHLNNADIDSFLMAEYQAATEEIYFEQAFGRVLATRRLLTDFMLIVQRREVDLNNQLSEARQRQFKTSLADVLRVSLQKVQQMLRSNVGFEEASITQRLQQRFVQAIAENALPEGSVEPSKDGINSQSSQDAVLGSIAERLAAIQSATTALQARQHLLQKQQDDLLDSIYFQPQKQTTSHQGKVNRWKLLLQRGFSLLTGRDYFLHRKLLYSAIRRLEINEQRLLQSEQRLQQAEQSMLQTEQWIQQFAQAMDSTNHSLGYLSQRIDAANRYFQPIEAELVLLETQIELFEKLISYEGR